MTLKYHLFLSCEDILINGHKIEDLINKIIEQDPQAGNNEKKLSSVCAGLVKILSN